jgi:hypothetical protein
MTIFTLHYQEDIQMTNGCKNICQRIKSKLSSGTLRYANGHKYCSICEVYMKTEELRCICCKARLRGNPRNLRSKLMYRESKELL